MSGICGWFDPAGTMAATPPSMAAMTETLTRFDNSKAQSALSGFGGVATAGASGESSVFRDDRCLVAVWGRPRFTNSDFASLAQNQGIGHALASAYAQLGAATLPLLTGRFAVAVLDGHKREAILATDRIGSSPICHLDAAGKLIFGSTLDAVNAFPGIQTEIDHQAIYNYVYFHMVPAPRMAHIGRKRLLPGTFLRWRPGTSETLPYFEMQYIEDEQSPFAELKEEFLNRVRASVSLAAQSGSVGAFLSGGTDSSTIAGMLSAVTSDKARTFSIGFEAQGYDEMEYARIAARHFQTLHHEHYVTPAEVVSAIPKIAAIYDQPFGNSSAIPAYYCAKLAKENGVDTLLGGDGGDELFGGNERYAKQYLYSLYSDLPSALRKGLIEPLAFLPPGVGLLGKIQRYIRNASTPMPARYDNYNLLQRLGPTNVFSGDFLSQIDKELPGQLMAESYHQAHAHSLVNRMLAIDMRFTLADNDLPKVVRSCELAGVESRFPLLDDNVVAFSSRLAPSLKLKRTRLRHFFKEALRGFLPDQILTKTKHGFGLPFGPWLNEHAPLRAIALDSLTALKCRHIVRPQLIDELTSIHLENHAGYYGTMIWVLMMLEQWFQRNACSD